MSTKKKKKSEKKQSCCVMLAIHFASLINENGRQSPAAIFQSAGDDFPSTRQIPAHLTLSSAQLYDQNKQKLAARVVEDGK